MGEDEHGSGEGVAFAPRVCPPIIAGFHSPAYLNGSPADEHGAGGRCGLLQPGRVISMKSKIQSCESSALAMKPSSDIALFTTTLPFPVLVFLTAHLPQDLRGLSSRAASDDAADARPNLIASPAIKATARDGDDREARLDAVGGAGRILAGQGQGRTADLPLFRDTRSTRSDHSPRRGVRSTCDVGGLGAVRRRSDSGLPRRASA